MVNPERLSTPSFGSIANEAQRSDAHWRSLWSLDPAVIFLNHGSFGACPIPVLAYQRSLRDRLEQEPVRFFAQDYEVLLDQARQDLADFVGVDAANLVFVPNATSGVNAVLRSLTFHPGDELLTTNHEYNASRNVLNFVAERAGATVVVADIPFPVQSADQLVDAVLASVSARTRLVLLDHVSSQTALIFPIEPIAHALQAQGIDLLIDGAHAPGMIPLNLKTLGATYYTGNCHKWLCAPKGAGFLYVHPDRQADIRPTVISHGANSPRCDRSRFQLEFDWMGTGDPSAYLSVPEAIRFMGGLVPGEWSGLMQWNHEKAVLGQKILCEALKIDLPCPPQMIGSMATLPLPDGNVESLYQELSDRYHIQVPIIPWQPSPQRLIRISAQLYNTPADYEALANALIEILP